MNSFTRLYALLDETARRRLVLLIVLSVVSAALSVASIAFFGPFMRLIADPDRIYEGIVGGLYTTLGFSQPRTFLMAAGGVAFFLILLSNLAKVITVHGIHRFAGTQRYLLSLRLFRRYLYQPWALHIERNTSSLSQVLLNEVDTVVSQVLRPAMDAFSQGVVVLGILSFLLAASPLIALAVTAFLVAVFAAIYLLLRPALTRLGREHWYSNGLRFSAAAEAFGAMKELKVLHLEENYSENYSVAAQRYAVAEMWLQTWSTIPRQVLEAFAFGLIIVLILVLLTIEGTMAGILPLLAIYALSGYRLMPALQVVYNSVVRARYFSHTVDELDRDMQKPLPTVDASVSYTSCSQANTAPFECLRLDRVSFRYRGTRLDVLSEVSLEIHRNETIAFVGTTGCGKTTLVDIILGLFEPTSGDVLVNGIPRPADDDSRRALQSRFGYVPQSIFLADATVTENIALGIPPERIDHAAVERAARTANLHEFVTTELAAGYATVVGERGVRLSGGQCQRIGIARALYHNPDLLVLDEATNALDTVTETAVMQAVADLHHRKTLILVAHRLTSVRLCDRIYLLDRGRITATGTYDHLLATSPRFRALAG